ncbi:Uncharacterised protein [Mycobacteroides abscessus subsp. abscessus]|nr:Uncharacterised protein [Mycobacteroides abscessus subsp. abscessus]SHX12475.1 Uncharacterised protein [Mycobacteroides abscessus subsp. abscessus]SIA37645.1 Uncharacterised protein [Mycobacteroides abscessus subsp. abscessus]SIL43334.1 Uncharacterised protein [Mycobacteroides abscessus subsp. abscessus]SIM67774.1 Uncharacterised protein [Mycobacteroides abscessus subsp. abscessus]
MSLGQDGNLSFEGIQKREQHCKRVTQLIVVI